MLGSANRLPLAMQGQQPVGEIRRRFQGDVRGFPVGRMPCARNDRGLDRAIAFGLRDLDMAQRAVLIAGTLDDFDGHAHISQRIGNIPVAELRIEPDVVPAAEGVVDIRVPAREPLFEIACLVVLLRLRNRVEAEILDDEMRRDQHQPAHAMILHAAGIDGRNRCAVGMAEQEAAPESDGVENFWQNIQRLDVHEVQRARQLDRR